MVAIYALLNVAVATGLMPTTGLPLPFVSYGGSSLLLNLSGIGILAAVAREKVPAGSPAWRLRGQLSRPHPPGSDGRWVQPPAPVGSR
jgi:cell division protein FtsW